MLSAQQTTFLSTFFPAALDCGSAILTLWPLVYSPASCFIHFLPCHCVEATFMRVMCAPKTDNYILLIYYVVAATTIGTDTTTTTIHICMLKDREEMARKGYFCSSAELKWLQCRWRSPSSQHEQLHKLHTAIIFITLFQFMTRNGGKWNEGRDQRFACN